MPLSKRVLSIGFRVTWLSGFQGDREHSSSGDRVDPDSGLFGSGVTNLAQHFGICGMFLLFLFLLFV